MEIGLLSYAIAAIAYLALTLVLLAGWKGRRAGTLLVLASALMTVWAGIGAFAAWHPVILDPTVSILETVRSGGWLLFLFSVLPFSGSRGHQRALPLLLRSATAILLALVIASDLGTWAQSPLALTAPGPYAGFLGRLLIAILGLVLVENLYRNTRPDRRWAIKFLCFGIGGIFAYDFFLYSQALLFHQANPVLLDARGFTDALLVPLIAVSAARNPEWSLDVFISRRVVFHSAALIGGGVYLLLMAAAGYSLREFGGGWGPILQVTFLTGAVVLLFVVLFSGRVRGRLKVFVNKHFYSYKYDYRDEWLRFIRTIASDERGGNLREKVIQAVADIIDSPGGALWLRERGDGLVLAESWNLEGPEEIAAGDCPLVRFLEAHQSVVDLDDLKARPQRYPFAAPPEWLDRIRDPWLIIPLVHHERLTGLIVLGRARAPRRLNWEDFELLKTIGCQSASYLAEQDAAEALAEARQFDAFNRRFAFIIHDIKNVVSELSLIVSNATRHRDNPVFQEDVLRTVEESVSRMNRLLFRLKSDQRSGGGASVALAPLLRRAVNHTRGAKVAVTFECQGSDLSIQADGDRLGAVVGHLIQNAMEAVGNDGTVQVRLRTDGGQAVIEVEDDGPGMDAEFIRDHLFRPFRTTKKASFGIGLYESREYARQLGGRLEVLSEPGRGTMIRLSVPVMQSGGEGGGIISKVTAE